MFIHFKAWHIIKHRENFNSEKKPSIIYIACKFYPVRQCDNGYFASNDTIIEKLGGATCEKCVFVCSVTAIKLEMEKKPNQIR